MEYSVFGSDPIGIGMRILVYKISGELDCGLDPNLQGNKVTAE